MDDWRLCTRCGLVPGRARDDEPDNYLCDECRGKVEQLGDAATSLAHVLMRWGREQEWNGVEPEVLLEAVGLSFALFEARVLSGPALAGTPQLLHAEIAGDALELTLASDPTSVWRETFGSLESQHHRVPFLVMTEKDSGPVDVTLHYWDKRERAAMTLGFWAAEEQVLEEFSRAGGACRGASSRWAGWRRARREPWITCATSSAAWASSPPPAAATQPPAPPPWSWPAT